MTHPELDRLLAEHLFGIRILTQEEMVSYARKRWEKFPQTASLFGGIDRNNWCRFMANAPDSGEIVVKQVFHSLAGRPEGVTIIADAMLEKGWKYLVIHRGPWGPEGTTRVWALFCPDTYGSGDSPEDCPAVGCATTLSEATALTALRTLGVLPGMPKEERC